MKIHALEDADCEHSLKMVDELTGKELVLDNDKYKKGCVHYFKADGEAQQKLLYDNQYMEYQAFFSS